MKKQVTGTMIEQHIVVDWNRRQGEREIHDIFSFHRPYRYMWLFSESDQIIKVIPGFLGYCEQLLSGKAIVVKFSFRLLTDIHMEISRMEL